MTPAGFPHSDTPGSTLGCQLPRAYRRLLRPSSALDAKASTMCPSQLVTHTTNPTGPPPTQPNRAAHAEDKPKPAVHTTHHKKTPTHPPQSQRACATNNKQTQETPGPQDARVHYPDLKQQPHTSPTPHNKTPTRPGHTEAPDTHA